MNWFNSKSINWFLKHQLLQGFAKNTFEQAELDKLSFSFPRTVQYVYIFWFQPAIWSKAEVIKILVVDHEVFYEQYIYFHINKILLLFDLQKLLWTLLKQHKKCLAEFSVFWVILNDTYIGDIYCFFNSLLVHYHVLQNWVQSEIWR